MSFEVITEIASPLICLFLINSVKKQGNRKQMTLEGRPLKYIQCSEEFSLVVSGKKYSGVIITTILTCILFFFKPVSI